MKKPLFIKIILLIVILLTIFYSVYICKIQNIDFINWLNTLIATVISVLLALLIAIYIFYYQTNSIQEETRNKFIPLIEGTLIGISEQLSSSEIIPMKIFFNDGKEYYFYLNTFQSIVFEQAIYSNAFNKKQTEFLLNIKVATDFHNYITNILMNMHWIYDESPDKYRHSLEFLHSNHEKSRKELKQSISSANKYFKFDELNKEINQNHSNTLE